jgi:hypothetical protein
MSTPEADKVQTIPSGRSAAGLLFEIGNILHCLESPSELCYDFFDTVERQREWPLRNIN